MKGYKTMYQPNRSNSHMNNKNTHMNQPDYAKHTKRLNDYGAYPFVINIDKTTLQNDYFRTALWTGKYLQLTLMSIKPGEDIGFEIHPNVDQFLRIEQGEGIVMMGSSRQNLDFQKRVYNDDAIIIPANTWHNLINTGRIPLKLYSIYAPPQHPFGTVHVTKQDEKEHH